MKNKMYYNYWRVYRFSVATGEKLCLCGKPATTETKYTHVPLCPTCADATTKAQLSIEYKQLMYEWMLNFN